MSTTAVSILFSLQKIDFRDLVYNEVEKELSGDYTALLDDVFDSVFTITKFDLQNEIADFLRQKSYGIDLKGSIYAFDNINGKKYFPQILIPFYMEYKSGGLLKKQQPILVVFDGNESLLEYDGFQMQNGNIKQVKVDENFALKNEVWVINLNEIIESDSDKERLKKQVGGQKKVEPLDAGRQTVECDDGNPDTPSEQGIDVYMESLGISCHKESWISGASEVEIKLTSRNATNAIWYWGWENGIPTKHEFGTYHLKTFKRSEIGNGPYLINKTIVGTAAAYVTDDGTVHQTPLWWGTITPDPLLRDERYHIIYYAIYEHDTWPNGSRRVADVTSELMPFAPLTAYIHFVSADSEYDKGWFSWYKHRTNGEYPCGIGSGHNVNYPSSGCANWIIKTRRP